MIFDSTNQVFDSLIQTKKHQLTTKSSTLRQTRSGNSVLKHLVRRAIDSKSRTNQDDRYPTFGMDIPKSCKDPSKHHFPLEYLSI